MGYLSRDHQLVLLDSLNVLVLQATAWPRVGGVLLYTLHFLSSVTGCGSQQLTAKWIATKFCTARETLGMSPTDFFLVP